MVSKSGTTLETLTNGAFVENAIKNAGLDPAKHMIAVTSATSISERAGYRKVKPVTYLWRMRSVKRIFGQG